MDFAEAVRGWVQCDNELTRINEVRKQLVTRKAQLSDAIHSHSSQIPQGVIAITDGTLKLKESKTRGVLTLAYVQECLEACVYPREQVQAIMEYIRSRRPTRTNKEIIRCQR